MDDNNLGASLGGQRILANEILGAGLIIDDHPTCKTERAIMRLAGLDDHRVPTRSPGLGHVCGAGALSFAQ